MVESIFKLRYHKAQADIMGYLLEPLASDANKCFLLFFLSFFTTKFNRSLNEHEENSGKIAGVFLAEFFHFFIYKNH